ncbi:MAG: glucose-6-phosphate isomerase, partial [Burkholderia sp.]|nr:glucose-6-phosphate isomerase [Burkholderia sp.]
MSTITAERAPSRNRRWFAEPKHWAGQAGLWTLTAALIAVHQGKVLTLAFPVLAIAVGIWLYFKSPARYVGFMWWVWFLSPEVRRLADWSKGAFTPTSLIQVAPLAVTMIAGLGLLRH